MVYLPHAFGIGTDASPRSIAFGNIRVREIPKYGTSTTAVAATVRVLVPYFSVSFGKTGTYKEAIKYRKYLLLVLVSRIRLYPVLDTVEAI